MRQPDSPLRPNHRMAKAVSARIRTHSLLEAIRDAGHITYVSFHPEAIWLSVMPSKTQPGVYELEYRVEHPRWWKVAKYSFEDHADRLAGKLAEGLMGEWLDNKDPQ